MEQFGIDAVADDIDVEVGLDSEDFVAQVGAVADNSVGFSPDATNQGFDDGVQKLEAVAAMAWHVGAAHGDNGGDAAQNGMKDKQAGGNGEKNMDNVGREGFGELA